MASTYPHYLKHTLDLEDSFRLIELLPGAKDDPINVALLKTRLSDSPLYEAVSYVWGDTSLVRPIRVVDDADHADGVDMTVTVNCYDALRRLRQPGQRRMLWIDSICIDQQLVRERNHQLSLMARIYSGASRVVAYLGEAADESDTAMDWIREIDRPSDYSGSFATRGPAPTLGGEKAAIQALLQRPWFGRVWVLQEITLARDAIVICGDRQLEWDCFKTFRFWNTSTGWFDKLPYSLESQKTPGSKSFTDVVSFEQRLQNTLVATRDCAASDARDKLYGILPLLEWEHRAMLLECRKILDDSDQSDYMRERAEYALKREIVINPDYAQSIIQVYTDLAAKLLRFFGLDLLLEVHTSPSNSRLPGLPSWVPDWRPPAAFAARRRKGWAGFKLEPKDKWHLNRELRRNVFLTFSKPSSPHSELATQLHVSGVRVGSISKIGEACDISQNKLPLKQWENLVSGAQHHLRPSTPSTSVDKQEDRPRPRGPESHPSFERIITNDDIVYGRAIESAIRRIHEYNGDIQCDHEEDYDCIYRDNKDIDGARAKGEKLPLDKIFAGMVPSYRRQAKVIFLCCDGQRLFVTDTGYSGLAPTSAKAGDLVFVLEGAEVPFVFRGVDCNGLISEGSTEDNRQYVSLLGRSFVDGVMYGEVWNAAGDGKAQTTVEEIVIR